MYDIKKEIGSRRLPVTKQKSSHIFSNISVLKRKNIKDFSLFFCEKFQFALNRSIDDIDFRRRRIIRYPFVI